MGVVLEYCRLTTHIAEKHEEKSVWWWREEGAT